MKKKYLIGIIIIAIIVFVGIEAFRKVEKDNTNEINTTNNEISEPANNTTDNTINNSENTIENGKTEEQKPSNEVEEIQSGDELLEKAEATLIARGWAGASNNIVGLKDGNLYYYNKESKEIKKIATGIQKIYYETEDSEEITAQKGNDAKIIDEKLTFIIYK